MRRLRAAIFVSVASHGAGLAWIAHDGGVLAVPLHDRPLTAAAAIPAPPPSAASDELTVVLLDPQRAPAASDARAAPAVPARPPTARPAISTRAAGSTGSREVVTSTSSTARGDEPAPANGGPGHSWMTIRRPDGPLPRGMSSEFVTRFLEHDKPLPPPPDIPWERLTEQIKEARRHPELYGQENIVALTRQLAAEELKPTGGGTFGATKQTFTATVDPDGTTHVKDRPEQLDRQDRLMLSHGIDPYGRNKLAFLDRTRDQRVAVGERYRHHQLGRSTQLMQRNIDRLWATTIDVAARKAGLFELWDDCAESGSDDLIAGGAAARAFVVGVIRARLVGPDAYTAVELAELNARRHSRAVFAPYD